MALVEDEGEKTRGRHTAVDPEQRPIGALNALDLMRAGIF